MQTYKKYLSVLSKTEDITIQRDGANVFRKINGHETRIKKGYKGT